MDLPTAAAEPAPAAVASPARVARRPRLADQPLDAASMIQDVVSRLQEQGDRLRDTIRKAIAVLQAAVGGAS